MRGVSSLFNCFFLASVVAQIFYFSPLQAQNFLRDLVTRSPGDLSKYHQEWDSVSGCVSCHVNQLGGDLAEGKCLDCHPKIASRIEEDRGYHRGKTICSDCHQEHAGREAYIFAPSPNWVDGYTYGPEDSPKQMPAFDHGADAQWPLRGKHAAVECNDCHTQQRTHYKTGAKSETRTFLGASTRCYDCHQDVYKHEFSRNEWLDCETCHSSSIQSWKRLSQPMPFDHNTTDYPLQGLHRPVACASCHSPQPGKVPVTTFAPLAFGQCTDCHADPHQGKFGSDCESCHSVFQEWNDVKVAETGMEGFDHNTTAFPLNGYHKAVACESCHYREDGSYKFQDRPFAACSDCHGLPHGEQFAGQSCQDCHTEEQKFYESTYSLERHNQTDFALDGKHQVLNCQSCHSNGIFENLPHESCSNCHVNVHPERQIDRECQDCHNTTSFSWIQFDHNRQTDFNLTGKHQEVACLSCHVDQIFKNMPADNANPNCQMCHADPHGDAMPNACADCHRTEGFQLVRNFDHGEFGFVLDGRHSEISCQSCHPKHLLSDYKIPNVAPGANAQACVNCHMDVHDGAYGSQCQSCHNTSRFEVAGGEKVHDLGFFELKGAHDQMDCQTCHTADTNLQGLGPACGWCHEKDDIHLGAFGLECQDCHSQEAWFPSQFKHNTTAFRLTGAHRFVACESCHVNQVYSGLPNDCYFCHVDSFVNTLTSIPDPHQGGRDAALLDCSSCHVPVDWKIRRGGGIE